MKTTNLCHSKAVIFYGSYLMGPGFYLMIAMSIIIARVANAERRRDWLWFGINLSVSMMLGRSYGLTSRIAVFALVATLFIMCVVNIVAPVRSR